MSKTRSKRSAGSEQCIHQIISPLVDPAVKGAFKVIATAVTGGQDPFFNKLVLPNVDDKMEDPRTMNLLQQMAWMAKYAYGPATFDLIRSNLMITIGVAISQQTEEEIQQINLNFFMET
ncbi:hypothetical protein TNCV_239611 [Trichonephila clavipes]|nr:hypothetical protein TNCV_239611 [Trichonephila clavipes]